MDRGCSKKKPGKKKRKKKNPTPLFRNFARIIPKKKSQKTHQAIKVPPQTDDVIAEGRSFLLQKKKIIFSAAREQPPPT